MSVYPGSLDTLATDKTNTTDQEDDHPAHHNDLADAVNKIEAELGTTPSGSFTTVRERLEDIEAGVGATVDADPIWDAKGDLAVGSGADAADNLPVGANDRALISDSAQTLGVKWAKVGEAMLLLADVTTADVSSSAHGFAPKSPADATKFLNGATTPAYAQVKDSDLSTSDITTNDVSTSKHGFVPKAPADNSKFLRGDGAWAVATLPSGSSAMGTDALWDAKGDLAGGTGANTAARLPVGANGTSLRAASGETTGLIWLPGSTTKLYDYEVSGSDKASIDTNADGTTVSDFAGYDVLEVWLLGRTDESAAVVNTNLIVNNDTSSIYDQQNDTGLTNTPACNFTGAQAQWTIPVSAATATTGRAGAAHITIPFYASTTFWKEATAVIASNDGTAGNNRAVNAALCYRSTSALTRIKWSAAGSAKLKIGSRMIVYGR